MAPRGSLSSKARILAFFLANVGVKLKSDQIQAASGNASEWARRTRELRDLDGWQIHTHRDRADLKPGEYILETQERLIVKKRDISKETRALVLERDGYTCQVCGVASGDPDPLGGTRTVRLTMGHIRDKSMGGDDSPSNLRAECFACNEGKQNVASARLELIQLLAQVRRATIDDQKAILDWLLNKFRGRASGTSNSVPYDEKDSSA